MKAFTKSTYGGPEVLRLSDIALPAVADTHLRVRVLANSVNPADWHLIRGKPVLARLSYGLLRPRNRVPGADFAGVVAYVGKQVTRFREGDWVFGATLSEGAFAEYISVPEDACALMPPGAGFVPMACVPMAGVTALQALHTHGRIEASSSVLINGASGGVGHFAVQLAKAAGAHVTAVCSSRKASFVRELGADAVIEYDREDLRAQQRKWDLVLDIQGNLSYADFVRLGRRGVTVGFSTMSHLLGLQLRKATGKFPLLQFTASVTGKDLDTLAALIAAGRLQVHIERTYALHEIPEALAYIEQMRTRGKVAIKGM